MNDEAPFPHFSDPVVDSGYRWWYADASSDDGQHHLVVIAFVGSVFSPFYKRATDLGPASPMDYCAINVALYSRRQARWVMSECVSSAVHREPYRFEVANTQLSYAADVLTIDIDERAAPLPRRVTGQVRLYPAATTSTEYTLDSQENHFWWPFAPSARVEVRFTRPDLNWNGHGYIDTNRGLEPLHEGFDTWHWSRTHLIDAALLTYSAQDRHGAHCELGLRIDHTGKADTVALAPASTLPASPIWRAPRSAHLPGAISVVNTLEDTPFYARSIVSSDLGPSTMHESLSLHRFRSTWVTTLIPFRMRFPLSRLAGPRR